MPSPQRPEDLLPLSPPVFQVLISLSEQDLHGYAIIGAVRGRTGETLSTSTLYGAIKRMIRDGLIREAPARPAGANDDERRRYYRITPFGRQVAHREAQRIERLAEMIRGHAFVQRSP